MKAGSQKNWTKILVLMPLAATLMGNQQSCQQQPAATRRELKKIVELEKIKSAPINFGAAGTFDFQFVANQQIISVLQNSDKFAFRLVSPVQSGPVTGFGTSSGIGVAGKIDSSGSDLKSLNLSKADSAMMDKFVSTASLEKPAVLATESKEAWCMVNNPQAVISGAVNSFEMLGGGGLSIGFTPSGSHSFSLTAASVQIDVLQLDLSMQATSPLTQTVLGASDVTSNQTKTNVSFGLDLGLIHLGPSFYYQLPLAAVTKNALTKAVNALKLTLDKVEWFSRVLANKDSELVIVGGTNVNLKVGDEVAIYNEVYYWVGEPCNSQLQYDGLAKSPVAKGVVSAVGNEISSVTVTSQLDEIVQIGAKVKLVKYVEDIQAAAGGSASK